MFGIGKGKKENVDHQTDGRLPEQKQPTTQNQAVAQRPFAAQKPSAPQESEHAQKQKSERYRVKGSFRAQVIAGCVAVATSTALLITCFTVAVFDSYFRSYSTSNIDAIAEYLNVIIGNEFRETGTLNNLDMEQIREGLQLSSNVGIMIMRDNEPDLPSWPRDAQGGEVTDMSLASQMSTSDIIVDNAYGGTLVLWMNGTDNLIGRFDAGLRNDTIRAMVIVGIVSVLIAIIVGIVFSYTLAKPIRLISAAAQRISRGDLKARSNVLGNNEIGQLGESFDAMAESIERDKNMEMQLTSDVAHELRTPLMAIQATIEAMVDGVYDVTPERLELVDSEVQRLSRLVNAMLSLSRLERRSEPMHEQVCDLGSIVEAVFEADKILARDAGLEFSMHIIEDSKVMCDSDRIRQAITNLVSNSLRYTKEGHIDLYVRREGNMAAVDVSDTGIGLDSDEERMVFSRFWRSDASRSQESGGLGVGLAVVKEIVNRHGGHVTVNGKKGVGSTFTIYLPVYEPEVESKGSGSHRGSRFTRHFMTGETSKASAAKGEGSKGSVRKATLKGAFRGAETKSNSAAGSGGGADIPDRS